MKKQIFCLIATNGSGKTTLTRLMIQKHQFCVVNVYRRERWDVIASPFVNGRVKTPDDKALIVGEYGDRSIGGADQWGWTRFFNAMKKAVKYRGANRILVEALKISHVEFYRKLEKFCRDHNCSLHTTFIKVDPVVAYKRQVERGARRATYKLPKVMMRFARCRYLYETIPADRKAMIENEGDPQVASDKLLSIIMRSSGIRSERK